jgi:hypothetical protein
MEKKYSHYVVLSDLCLVGQSERAFLFGPVIDIHFYRLVVTGPNNFRRSHYSEMDITTVTYCAVYWIMLCPVVLPFNGCLVSFPVVKLAGLDVDVEPPFCAYVNVGRTIPVFPPLCLQWNVGGDLYLYCYVPSCSIMTNLRGSTQNMGNLTIK